MVDLKRRFEAVSRGRPVRIEEIRNTLFNYDFEVSYDKATNSFLTQFTRNGWFEEAYRFIERWIKKHAEKLDGTYRPPPPGWADFTEEANYWIFERCLDRYLADFQTAIRDQMRALQTDRPNEGVLGEVSIGARIKALRGLSTHLERIADEVHAAIFSPGSIEFLKAIGQDIFEEKKQS